MFMWKVWKLISLLKINLYILFDLRYFVRTCFWPVFLGFALEFSFESKVVNINIFLNPYEPLSHVSFFQIGPLFFSMKKLFIPSHVNVPCYTIWGKNAQENKTFLTCCFFYSVPCSIPEKLLGFFLMQIWAPFQLLDHLAQTPHSLWSEVFRPPS